MNVACRDALAGLAHCHVAGMGLGKCKGDEAGGDEKLGLEHLANCRVLGELMRVRGGTSSLGI